MNKHIITLAAASMALGLALTACDDDFTQPPVVVPQASLQPNTTLLELKEAFDSESRDNAALIGTKENGDHYIVKGRITSSDETGNIYQKLFVEDETAGMCFSIYMKELYKSYRFGQEIVVDVTGMYLGNYGYMPQVGGAPSGTYANPSRMEEAMWTAGAEVNGLAEPSKVEPAVVTLEQLATIKADHSQFLAWTGRYIRLDGMHFENPGQDMAVSGQNNCSRTALDGQGLKIALNNSGYSSFWNEKVPSGTGSILAELSYYNNDWQLLISSMDDLVGFDATTPDNPGQPEEPDQPSGPATEGAGSFDITFASAEAFPAGWTTATPAASKQKWFLKTYQGNNYACATGYNNGTAPFEMWLISEPLDISKMAEKTLTFETQVNGYGSTTSRLEVFVMDSPDIKTASLTALDPDLADAPASGYSQWVGSGIMDLSAVAKGVFYIGWRYTATEDANYATWCVDNIVAK